MSENTDAAAKASSAGDPRELKRALEVLPHVLELFEASPLHFLTPVHVFFDHVFPSLVNGQFRLLFRSGKPAAFVNWAWLSPEVSARYDSARRYVLKADDWLSGTELWFCEIVAREGMMYSLIRDLQHNVFPGGTRARWLRLGPSGELLGLGEVRMPSSPARSEAAVLASREDYNPAAKKR